MSSSLITLRTLLSAAMLALLCNCESVSWPVASGNHVVFALGSRAGFPSPLEQQLKPACPALEFSSGELGIPAEHERELRKLAAEAKNTRHVIAGYARPGLPPEYARVLAERRAHAVRHRLIELGMEPATLQTAGFGNDFPQAGPTTDVVVIYQINE